MAGNKSKCRLIHIEKCKFFFSFHLPIFGPNYFCSFTVIKKIQEISPNSDALHSFLNPLPAQRIARILNASFFECENKIISLSGHRSFHFCQSVFIVV